MDLQLGLACLFVLLGSIVQTAFGFGLAIVAAPLLMIVYPELVPGPLIMAALFQCILMMLDSRKDLDISGLTSAVIGRLPGSWLGALALTVISVELLSIGVGVLVIVAVVFSLSKYKVRPTTYSMFWASMASGFLGSATSVGGPPMALLLQHESAAHIRANLAGYFVYGTVVSLVMLSMVGRFGLAELKLGLWLTPFAIAGFFICRWLPVYRLGDNLRPMILWLCVVSGVIAILKGGLSLGLNYF